MRSLIERVVSPLVLLTRSARNRRPRVVYLRPSGEAAFPPQYKRGKQLFPAASCIANHEACFLFLLLFYSAKSEKDVLFSSPMASRSENSSSLSLSTNPQPTPPQTTPFCPQKDSIGGPSEEALSMEKARFP